MATASRTDSGAYNTKYTHVIESWFNGDRAQDVVFKPTPYLWLLNAMARPRPLGPDLTIRLLMDESEGVDSFEYYDTVSTSPSKGAQAGRLGVANYSGPVAMSWQEEMEFTAPTQIADRIREYITQVEMTFAQRFGKDVYRGSVSKSTNIEGLEQMFAAATHLQNGGGAATATTVITNGEIPTDRFRVRQTTGTYAGITRTAYTSADTGGTGWEHACINMFGQSTSPAALPFGFVTGGAPNYALKLLHAGYDLASWGIDHPDLIVSTLKPYQDYIFAAQEKMEVTVVPGQFGDAQLSFNNIKFRGAMWIYDEMAKSYDTSGVADSAALDNVYLLNTDYVHFVPDSRANMVLGDPRTPVDQHAGVRHMLWRGQHMTDNPRAGCRLVNYTN